MNFDKNQQMGNFRILIILMRYDIHAKNILLILHLCAHAKCGLIYLKNISIRSIFNNAQQKYIFWLVTFFMYKVNFSANQFEIHQMYCMNGLSIKN